MFRPAEPITIVDTETTSLRRGWHQSFRLPVEIGAIRVQPDGTQRRLWVFVTGLPIDFDDEHTAQALRLNGYHRRHPDATGIVPDGAALMDPVSAAEAWIAFSAGSALAGANVSFDEETLTRLCHWFDLTPSYLSHQMLNVSQLAGEVLGWGLEPSKWRLGRLAAALEVPFDADRLHTALGDAELELAVLVRCRELLDAPVAVAV